MEGKVFGIDLGTTNSAIAVFEGDEPHIIKNTEGAEITPSVIFFSGVNESGEDDMIVGASAKNAAATSPENVVQFVKRLMGNSGTQYNFRGPSGREYTPEILSAFILMKVCKDAEEYVGSGEVKNVVITVPAYFDDARRTATKQAGRIAGLNVLSVVNEPTAAAIAFGIDKSQNGKALVYDLGGGTFDVTVMDIKDGHFDVIATGGDAQLGGINFDQKMIALILKALEEQGCTVDDENDALMAEIREKAEAAKKQLSRVETTRPFFTIEDKTYKVEITREAFEKESSDLLRRTEFLLNEVLQEKDIQWGDIDHLLLVGGSTRMPMVKKMLEQISGKEITYKVDPDTAVALGAATFASTLSNDDLKKDNQSNNEKPYDSITKKITVSDVTSQSLGVITVDPENNGKKMNTIIIPHNSKIPCKRSEVVYTVVENQTKIQIEVTEGDDEDVDFVKIIGNSLLTIPPYPKNSPVEIVYAYDPDQTVSIEVIDKVTDKSLGTFEIDRSSNLTDEQVTNATDIAKRTNID